MSHSMAVAGVMLGAALVCPAPDTAAGAAAPAAAGPVGCVACLHACTAPLSFDDALLDDATDLYLPAAVREVATTAAIDMAATLKQVFDESGPGNFRRVYEAHSAAIASLSAKHPPNDGATTAEINALKRARTALYVDAVLALQAASRSVQSERVAAAYKARAAVLDSVAQSMSARQQMRGAERLAVCQVLAAYDRE